MARIKRTIRLYTLHARDENGPVDYGSLFDYLLSVQPSERIVSLPNDLSVAVEEILREGSRYLLRLLVGNPSEIPLLFDMTTGQSTPSGIRRNQWLASVTRVVIDLTSEARTVALELRRNGISATTLERVIDDLGSTEFPGLKTDLNPLASQSFLTEIEQFSRIREATLVVSRPNFDWSDHNDRLHELAEESGASKAESTVVAGREQSLEKDRGLVGYIKRIASQRLSDIKNATIRGVRYGENQESSVSLQRNVLSGKIEIDSSLPTEEQDRAIWAQSERVIDSVGPRAERSDRNLQSRET